MAKSDSCVGHQIPGNISQALQLHVEPDRPNGTPHSHFDEDKGQTIAGPVEQALLTFQKLFIHSRFLAYIPFPTGLA